jgi:hypothetical protein
MRGDRLMIEVNGMGAARVTVPGDDTMMVLQMPLLGFDARDEAA